MFVALIDIHWWWHDGGKWFSLSEIGLSVVSILLPLKRQSWIGKIVKRQIIFFFLIGIQWDFCWLNCQYNFINMGIFIVLPNQISLPKAKMPFKNAFLKHHPLQKSSTICNDTTKIFKIMSRVLKIMTQLLLLPCSTTHRDLKTEKVEFRN